MKIIELVLDELDELNGIEAISIVENPAIEEDFIALKKQDKIKLAEVDKEKKILMGALLIPNKPIYRQNDEEEYYIYFSRETVSKASQKFLKSGNQKNSTLEHQMNIQGLTLVESWIKEDMVHDKSAKYNMDVPLGTWMGTVKVDNDQIWNDYVKTGLVKGFSIEGYFADKIEKPQDTGLKEELVSQDRIDKLIDFFERKELEQEDLKEPCWAGYEMIGTKMLNGKEVPNCVPIK